MGKINEDEQGGMALEATLIMPFFLAFILLLISFLTLAMADAALSAAASETVKQVAVHLYPLALAAKEASESQAGQKISTLLDNLKSLNEQISDTDTGSDSEFLNYLTSQKMWNDLVEPIAIQWMTPLFFRNADKNVLHTKHDELRIVKVILPNFRDKEKAYFGIEAEYAVTLPIPFFRKKIVLKKRAYERAWIGW